MGNGEWGMGNEEWELGNGERKWGGIGRNWEKISPHFLAFPLISSIYGNCKRGTFLNPRFLTMHSSRFPSYAANAKRPGKTCVAFFVHSVMLNKNSGAKSAPFGHSMVRLVK